MPAAAPATSDARAREVLRAWVDAQNAGRFADYERLFADGFSGVKRVGERSRTFDRKGWLEDRQRLFEKPVEVTVEDVHVDLGPRVAEVRFVQIWESGTFKDRGPKSLILIEEQGAVRILREVMLSSDLQAPSAQQVIRELIRRFGSGTLPMDECRKATGFSGAADSCRVESLAGGSGGTVDVVIECGGDTCDYRSFLFSALDPEARLLEDEWGATLELSPDHRTLWITNLSMDDARIESKRLDLTTGKTTPGPPCLSPTLSPGLGYYLCRDISGNVLAVPVEGNAPRRVLDANLPPGHRLKVGGPFHDYPDRVTFTSPTELAYKLYDETDEDVIERHATWDEAVGRAHPSK